MLVRAGPVMTWAPTAAKNEWASLRSRARHGSMPRSHTASSTSGPILAPATSAAPDAYKTLSDKAEAFDQQDESFCIVFETAPPFNTPRRMGAFLDILKHNQIDLVRLFRA